MRKSLRWFPRESETPLGLLLLLLLLGRGEQPEEHVPVLVVQGGDVHAEGVRHAVEVEAEGLQQRQEVDLLT